MHDRLQKSAHQKSSSEGSSSALFALFRAVLFASTLLMEEKRRSLNDTVRVPRL